MPTSTTQHQGAVARASASDGAPKRVPAFGLGRAQPVPGKGAAAARAAAARAAAPLALGACGPSASSSHDAPLAEQCEIPCTIGIGFSCDTDHETLREYLLDAVERAAAIDTLWYLREFLRGELRAAEGLAWTEPPCCPGCADFKHDPDRPGNQTIVKVIDYYLMWNEDTASYDVLCGSMSCGSAAAFCIGHERATIVQNLAHDAGVSLADLMSNDEAFDEALVHAVNRVLARIVEGMPPGGGNGKGYFHAVFVKDGEEEDPTKKMERI